MATASTTSWTAPAGAGRRVLPRTFADVRALRAVGVAAFWALAVVTFSLPDREVRSLSEGFDSLALLKLITRVGAASVLAVGLMGVDARDARRSAARALLPMGAFAGWCALSALWSPLPSTSAGQAFGLATLILLSAGVAVAWRDERDTSVLLLHASMLLLVVSGALLAVHAARPDFSGLERDPAGGLYHPTNAGLTASVGIVLAVCARLLWDWRWPRFLLPVALATHIPLLVVANSRTAVALAAVVSVAAAACRWRGRTAAAALLALSVTGVLYPIADPGFDSASRLAGRVETFLRREQSNEDLRSFTGRTELWPVVWEAYLEAPLRGHGYSVTSADAQLEIWDGSVNRSAHNLVLQVLVSTGVIGLALFAVALAWIGRSVAPLWARNGPRRLAWLVALLAMWYAGAAVLEESFLGQVAPQSVLFFLVLGIALGSARATRAERS